MLNLDVPLDQFVNELQKKMQELKIGVLRIEDVNEETGKIILTVAEDADCSGLPVLGETVCNYDEGFIAGILSLYSGKPYTAVEVDCWQRETEFAVFMQMYRNDRNRGLINGRQKLRTVI